MVEETTRARHRIKAQCLNGTGHVDGGRHADEFCVGTPTQKLWAWHPILTSTI